METQAIFGPAGNGDTFSQHHRSSVEAPGWLRGLGLGLLEYQCGRGIHIGEQTARQIGEKAREHEIRLSVHAPYFINLSSGEEERRQKNIGYVIASCQVAQWMGADRIVVHCGGLSGQTRQQAMEHTLQNLEAILEQVEAQGFAGITLCIETMGRQNVMGTLEEVIAICQWDRRLLPCIDFGHLNAREQGSLRCTADYERLLSYGLEKLGMERMRHFHAHFSHIEYNKGGEARHLTFAENQYGPFFEQCAPALVKLGLCPRVVCESAGTLPEDAQAMQQIEHRALCEAGNGKVE